MRPGSVYEYDLGKYAIIYNTAAYSFCTRNIDHYPPRSVQKGVMPEEALPHCHCGARQMFGYIGTVEEIIKRDFLGPGLGREVKTIEKRAFKLKRQRNAWVQRQVEKYREKGP